ncbi:hypothetical protein ACFQ21_00050 [Ohtaekwangia kribbensis]|uniref:Uncharacterized protein n=1 Tax=Ohtaekwangia kribbensis TaxID=688913 RepID=A0ABW3JUQ0_9BACT
MKKILTGNIVENVRRQPFNKASVDHIQEAYTEIISELVKGIVNDEAGVMCIRGCVDSDAGATAWNISAGAVAYNGEVYLVPAFVGSHGSNVPVLSLTTTYRAGDPVKFSDNNEYNVHEIKTAVWSMGASGSGLVDFSALKRMRDYTRPNNLNAGGLTLRPVMLNPGTLWDMDANGDYDVAHGLSDVTKIRSIDVMIKSNGGGMFPLMRVLTGGAVCGGITSIDATNITLFRITTANGGIFDSAGFNASTVYVTLWVWA